MAEIMTKDIPWYSLKDSASLDSLMNTIGDAQFVLLGEASHGTSEFYTWRSAITKRLIKEKGYSLIAVEGDSPDCYQITLISKVTQIHPGKLKRYYRYSIAVQAGCGATGK